MAEADEGQYGSVISGMIRQRVLVWDKDGTGRFRLQYEINTWDGSFDTDAVGEWDPWSKDEGTHQCKRTPLIETKFEVRKQMHPHLASFVQGLAEELNVQGLAHEAGTELSEDEIPF